MRFALAALFTFAILTLWVPAYWPVAVFEIGSFLIATILILVSPTLPPLSVPLIGFAFAFLWTVFQAVTGNSVYLIDTKIDILRWAAFFAVFTAGALLFRDAQIARWFRTVMVWLAFLVALFGTLQDFTADGKIFWIFPNPDPGDVIGPILYHNHYAAFIEAVLPMALYSALRDRDSWVYAGISATLYASVIASASRSGAIITSLEILVVCAILALTGRTGVRRVALSLAQLLLFASVLIVVVGWQHIWDRFMLDDAMSLRHQFQISAWRIFSDHFWWGSGLGTWPAVYPRYALTDVGKFINQAHCDWLQWAAEGGVFFAASMLAVFVSSLRPAFTSVWGIGAIAVFLEALVDYPFSRPALGAWTILVLSMLASYSSDRVNSESQAIQTN
jgi:O-Antigen ligase